MSGIVIGMDPRKVSVTIEVRDEREVLLVTGQLVLTPAATRRCLATAGSGRAGAGRWRGGTARPADRAAAAR